MSAAKNGVKLRAALYLRVSTARLARNADRPTEHDNIMLKEH